MTVPITSSEYGACHPPYAKPPLVSSSGPPPACMTPSRVTNSSTITFLMTEFLQHLAKSRSEEHTSELQSHSDLVCRLLLEKKKTMRTQYSEHRLAPVTVDVD